MKIQKFSGITWVIALILLISIAGCANTNNEVGPIFPTIIYTYQVPVTQVVPTQTPTAMANVVIVPDTPVPQNQTVSFFQPFQDILQVIIVPQATEIVPAVTETHEAPALPLELVNAIESFPTAIPTPSPTPTSDYVYPDGVAPLAIYSDGSVANVLPTPITNYVEKPPCDMNPLQYVDDYGSDALYDLADARDGKICAYTVVDYCPANLEKPNADWKLNKKLQAQLSTEGTEDDVWIYGRNIISIADEAGATLNGVEPTDLIILPEDEIDGLKIMLVSSSCSDPEGRFVLKPIGVYYLLDFLKSKIQ